MAFLRMALIITSIVGTLSTVTLAQNAGRVLTHGQLLEAVWGPAHVEQSQYLRFHVGQLRKKLGDDPENPRFIVTEPGVGYRLALD